MKEILTGFSALRQLKIWLQSTISDILILFSTLGDSKLCCSAVVFIVNKN